MPIDPGTTTPIFVSQLAANGLIGLGTPAFAAGMANGLFQYLTSGITVTSIDVGTLGAGTGVGTGLFLSQAVILQVLQPMMVGFGVFGPMSPAMASALSAGINIAMIPAIVQTVNPSVGIGAGKVQLIPHGTGPTQFISAFAAASMNGSKAADLATAIGTTLDSVIASTLGVIVIVGTPSIIPSTGLGTGTIS